MTEPAANETSASGEGIFRVWGRTGCVCVSVSNLRVFSVRT